MEGARRSSILGVLNENSCLLRTCCTPPLRHYLCGRKEKDSRRCACELVRRGRSGEAGAGRQGLVSPRSEGLRALDRGGPCFVRRPVYVLGERAKSRQRHGREALSLQSQRHCRPRYERLRRRGGELGGPGGTLYRRRSPRPGGACRPVRHGGGMGRHAAPSPLATPGSDPSSARPAGGP